MFQISLTSRNIEIDKKLNDYVNKELKEALKYSKDILSANIILSKQHNRYCTEITINGEGFNLHANGVNPGDIYLSIDGALDKMQEQVKRHREKKVSRKRRRQSTASGSMVSIISTRGESGFKIGRRRSLNLKPMDIEEAVMQLELSNDEFLVFSNAETDQINVVYKRNTGDYGLIEP